MKSVEDKISEYLLPKQNRIDAKLAKLMDLVRTGEHVPKAKVFAVLNRTKKEQPKKS
ncbi:MAG: hypothetical protein ACK48F_10890 [Chryseotalea sp.]|jgi:hypothetical protein